MFISANGDFGISILLMGIVNRSNSSTIYCLLRSQKKIVIALFYTLQQYEELFCHLFKLHISIA